MKLDAFDVEFFMADAHDDAVSGAGGRFEVTLRFAEFYAQRMVP